MKIIYFVINRKANEIILATTDKNEADEIQRKNYNSTINYSLYGGIPEMATKTKNWQNYFLEVEEMIKE